MELGVKARYRKHRGWDGKIYWVRMTEQEINARRILGLVACVVVGMPAFVLIMALAAGII